jgi:NAD(P)-dependent dehydrogenase (short-subunit alcohol dehydrogenase family)
MARGLELDFDRRLMLRFRGSVVTSYAGLVAYRELDDALGLSETAGERLADARTGKNGRHARPGGNIAPFWRPTMANKPTILIVGASRGLGLALVEQFCGRNWHVIATVRGTSPGLDALKARFPASLEEETTDIADEASVRALRQRLDGRTIDILFVNSGIAKSLKETASTAPVQDFLDMMLVNTFSPMRLIEIFEDIVAPNGTIAAMTSELGSITNNEGRWDLYASSKAALNMLMKCYSARRPDDRRAKLVVAPGWIQTEMGGSDATHTVEECIPLVADMLETNHGKPGLRYVDRFDRTLPW